MRQDPSADIPYDQAGWRRFQSLLGLNLLNLWLGVVIGVSVPFLTDYLKESRWSFSEIGVATALFGAGTLLFQPLSGLFAEMIPHHRTLLALVVFIYGLGLTLLPFAGGFHAVVDGLLFLSGGASAFFFTLSSTLAFSLSGHQKFARIMGQTQMSNHAGFLVSAAGTAALIHHLGLAAGFLPITLGSVLGILSIGLIRRRDMVYHHLAQGSDPEGRDEIRDDRTLGRVFLDFFRTPAVRVLLLSTALFQVANAPVMPLLMLYLRFLNGGNGMLAWVVILAQATMIPVAWAAARLSSRWGHKLVFSLAFFIMPLRSMICASTMNTEILLATQILDGVAAGIYGVSVALIVSDLTRGRKGFNLLMGLSQIAMALGSVVGPALQGVSVGDVGFRFAFLVFAGIAALAAGIFSHFMPDPPRAVP